VNDSVHIVCLAAPSPPDYGGAIDMYYKIVALAESGWKITLHYYQYQQGRDAGHLSSYCEKIYVYKRKKGWPALSWPLPYLVSSRINNDVITCLNKDDNPIILEGIHCTGIITYLKNKNRKIVVRIHNNEAIYYKRLAKAEKNIAKKGYYFFESVLLSHYQKKLPPYCLFACLSTADASEFSQLYPTSEVEFLPSFVAWNEVQIKTGSGNYCLYHGNMSVAENDKAAQWLVREVFSKVSVSLIIAGKGISKSIFRISEKHKHIKILLDPTINEIKEVVQNAHIHVLPSLNNTGVKLKLLHALFKGRYCITNNAGIEGSNIKSGISIANHPDEWIEGIERLFTKEFTGDEILQRQNELRLYNNNENAQKLSAWLR
jgi:hypothetical protein